MKMDNGEFVPFYFLKIEFCCLHIQQLEQVKHLYEKSVFGVKHSLSLSKIRLFTDLSHKSNIFNLNVGETHTQKIKNKKTKSSNKLHCKQKKREIYAI